MKLKINILPACLTVSLIGILLLLFLSSIYQPKLINIENINNKLLNKQVKIQATISNIRSFEGSNFQIISLGYYIAILTVLDIEVQSLLKKIIIYYSLVTVGHLALRSHQKSAGQLSYATRWERILRNGTSDSPEAVMIT